MEEELLKKALENNKNETILKLDSYKLNEYKIELLEQLNVKKTKQKEILKKLKHYRLIKDINEINLGSYIRWIPLKKRENIYVTNGGIICDIKQVNEDISIVCKNNMNNIFQLKMSECIIFQKLSNQEQILLSVIDYVNKNE